MKGVIPCESASRSKAEWRQGIYGVSRKGYSTSVVPVHTGSASPFLGASPHSTTWWPRWGGALLLRGGGAPVGEWQEAIEWDGAILRRCHPQYAAENAARAAGARAAVVRENARGRDGDADVQREMQMYMPTHMHRERGRGPQKTIEPSALSLGSGSPCAISSFSTPCSSTSTVPNSGRWSATSDQQRAMSRSRRSGT